MTCPNEPEPTEFIVTGPLPDTPENRERQEKHFQWLMLKYELNRLWARHPLPPLTIDLTEPAGEQGGEAAPDVPYVVESNTPRQ